MLPAMLYVAFLMMSSVKKMSFDGYVADAIGGCMAIIIMPFTYSISNGIMFGMLSWVILKIFTGKIKDIKPVMWISTALFALYYITQVM